MGPPPGFSYGGPPPQQNSGFLNFLIAGPLVMLVVLCVVFVLAPGESMLRGFLPGSSVMWIRTLLAIVATGLWTVINLFVI